MFFTVLTYLVIGLLAVFGLFYIVLEVRFFRALGAVRVGTSDVEPPPKVSVLISARNESAGIRATLDSVLAQDYRGDWEVWVADDRSDDDTPAILAEYAARDSRLHILTIKEIPEGVSPKKYALSQLIEACEGEILCLTDADCIVKPTWVSGIVAEFEPGIELVAGHSYIPTVPGKSSVLICMQAIETLIYRVAGTAGLAMRLPLTSTGNNLAYRKSFFKSVHGFDNVIKIQSGDDDLLMQKLAADRPWAMRYCIAESTFVTTNGKETLKELWEQRKRWASKTIYYTPGHTKGSVLIQYRNRLFSGDTLFAGSLGRTDLWGGNDAEMMSSLKRIKELPNDLWVYPGHGEATTIGQEKKTNPYLYYLKSSTALPVAGW